MKKYATYIFILFLVGCNGQNADIKSTIYYVNSKAEFNGKLVNHFPRIITVPNTIVNSKNDEKNNISFMLFEYNVNSKAIDSLIKFLENKKTIKYNSSDNCLLIVNRFETMETKENREIVEIKDSTKIEQTCYDKLLPIPNFIDYQNPLKDNDLKLEKNFSIYVLEAKTGNYFKEFELLPNPQMPIKWQNGYSKGIAIGNDENTIIYWAIVW